MRTTVMVASLTSIDIGRLRELLVAADEVDFVLFRGPPARARLCVLAPRNRLLELRATADVDPEVLQADSDFIGIAVVKQRGGFTPAAHEVMPPKSPTPRPSRYKLSAVSAANSPRKTHSSQSVFIGDDLPAWR